MHHAHLFGHVGQAARGAILFAKMNHGGLHLARPGPHQHAKRSHVAARRALIDKHLADLAAATDATAVRGFGHRLGGLPRRRLGQHL
ncbi:MAG: hypothetical protein HC802_16095 [Caldilineaceae bacterium]|nr:hypothetical protein [Caldilineaceae bacterium]